MATNKPVAGPALTLPVRDGEEPWTADEVAAVREALNSERDEMLQSIAESEADLAELMTEGIDGAGRDPADVGSSNFERDQNLSLHQNHRNKLAQTEQALKMLDAGTYGRCENCGQPIGKLRLRAFPRATMCVACKQRQERR